jgi:hypothetical protein
MDGSHAETRVPLGNGLELKLFPADGIHKSFFVPGPADDGVAGSCWLIPELERNLRICVCEKIDKIVPYKSSQKYLKFSDQAIWLSLSVG